PRRNCWPWPIRPSSAATAPTVSFPILPRYAADQHLTLRDTMPSINASPALKRFRVLDLSRVRAGPTCVRMLADFGADVIRIEPPPGIDPNEAMFAADRWSGDFQNLNRNKRSLTLNLKKPEGLEVFKKLVVEADVVV